MADRDPHVFGHMSKRDLYEVERMQREITRLEKALATMRGEVGESDTFAKPHSEHPRPLGTAVQVRFGGESTTGDTYDVEMRGGDLYVLVNGTTSETAIIPQSNNTIRIRKLPRRTR